MLRVVVESAQGLPKKRVGSPDPITSVIFRGMCLFDGFTFKIRGKTLFILKLGLVKWYWIIMLKFIRNDVTIRTLKL